ncbi:TIGR04211 family SH3 domain-containing protein [Methyloterricola oryzae]|uniref:TIGR04211 family SH3 domain-containing protein n=1 Tax=Methyloterricola oryzae TaxID=1495050 RepID=UPI0005EAF10E|nr:TIGR04211 family SH3 domain-containing protein [Methyloterricola oryzae]
MRILAVLLLSGFDAMAAEKIYVTDQLEVQLRTGQSLQHKIVKMVPSGSPVNLLQGETPQGYSLVALETGERGWILSRYLTTTPPARIQAEDSIRKAEVLEAENRNLKTQIAGLTAGKDAADRSNQDLSSETERLNSEIISIRQASANALQIQEERDQLQQKVINLERELETNRREMKALDDSNKQDWFLIGAGVLFGGIALGVILPRLSWRKRSSWDSF